MAWWLFQHVVVTSALAAGVLAVTRVVRPGPVVRHALWLVVLVKFVMPPIVAWPWGLPDPLALSAAASLPAESQDGRVVGATPTDAPRDPLYDPLALPAGSPRGAGGPGAEPPLAPVAASTVAADSAWYWLLALWVVGSVALLGIESVRLARVARRVHASRPANPALRRRVDELSAHLGVRPIEVRVVPGGMAPAVWSFGRARLLWPSELPADASRACVDGLLLHELAHVRRRDHMVGWIELLAGVLWWWNPIFWYVRSALREQAELACDAWVISALPDGRRAYAESLLALSGAALPGTPSMAVVGIGPTSRRMLERRLVMIMQGRSPVRLTRVGLLSLAFVAAVALPGWATAQSAPPPPPPPTTPPTPVRIRTVPPPSSVPVVTPAPLPPVVMVPPTAPASPPPASPVAIAPPQPTPPAPIATTPPAPPTLAPPASPPPAPRVQTQPPPPPPTQTPPRPVVREIVVPPPGARQNMMLTSAGEIHGLVTDQAETPMAGVQITLESDALRQPMVDVTSRSGRFEFPIVPVGTYRVSYERADFKKLVRTGIVIETGFQAEVNARLEPVVALPEAGQQLIDQFESTRDQIQRDAQQQIDARRQALVTALQSLQEELTRAGRLDEAVAIRDYIRALTAGGAGSPGRIRTSLFGNETRGRSIFEGSREDHEA